MAIIANQKDETDENQKLCGGHKPHRSNNRNSASRDCAGRRLLIAAEI
ncbi:hypothetical protein [Tepidicaulis sp.]